MAYSQNDAELAELFARKMAFASSPSTASMISQSSAAVPELHIEDNAEMQDRHTHSETSRQQQELNTSMHRSHLAASVTTAAPKPQVYYPSAPYIHYVAPPVEPVIVNSSAEPYMTEGYSTPAMLDTRSEERQRQEQMRHDSFLVSEYRPAGRDVEMT